MMNDYDGGSQAHIVVILIKILYMFTTKYSLFTMSTVYVPKYTVYVSPEYSLCISRVQFKSQEYSLCPQSAVYVLRVQFMSPEYSLCP